MAGQSINTSTTTQERAYSSEGAFGFVRAMAAELSAGQVDLPSFPEIAVRVRRVLSDQDASIEQVARLVGSEPALAARLLKLANSVTVNRTGKPVTDLRRAINRMGYNMVRTAAISFAMGQIRRRAKLKGLEHHLQELWQRCTEVSAFAYVLARSSTRINPDEAMLTGLMSGVGKLYVLTRAESHPELFDSPQALNDIIKDWHAVIGKSILENWDFADFMAEAVGAQDDLDRVEDVPPDLRDVIAVSNILASFAADPPALDLALHDLPAAKRLRLDEAKMAVIMSDSAAEIRALTDALGN
jgi:HD-like signal output (HDOD) protein